MEYDDKIDVDEDTYHICTNPVAIVFFLKDIFSDSKIRVKDES